MRRKFGDEEQGFLQSIHAEPRDDTARLVYADWLDDHERPDEAELIRLSVELARAHNRANPQLANRLNVLSRRMREHLALPVPRRMRFRRFERGLPLHWIAHPYSDLDGIFESLEWDDCLELEIITRHRAEYRRAMNHQIMVQVHSIYFPVLDEYDILELAETNCLYRPITITAAIIYPGALEACKQFLPRLTLQHEAFGRRPERKLRLIQSGRWYDLRQRKP